MVRTVTSGSITPRNVGAEPMLSPRGTPAWKLPGAVVEKEGEKVPEFLQKAAELKKKKEEADAKEKARLAEEAAVKAEAEAAARSLAEAEAAAAAARDRLRQMEEEEAAQEAALAKAAADKLAMEAAREAALKAEAEQRHAAFMNTLLKCVPCFPQQPSAAHGRHAMAARAATQKSDPKGSGATAERPKPKEPTTAPKEPPYLCNLVLSELNGGSFVTVWSRATPSDDALAFYEPLSPPADWRIANGGKSELCRGIGGPKARHAFYAGWCSFIKLAWQARAQLTLRTQHTPMPVAVFLIDSTTKVHAVCLEADLAKRREESASELPPPLHPDKCMRIQSADWETIKAIACTPSAVADFDGVATMTLRTFFEIGLRAGAAIGLDDGDGVAEAPPPLASPKPRSLVVSTEVSPLKAAILAASPTDLIFADLSSTASPDVAGRVARARAAATAASKKGEVSSLERLVEVSRTDDAKAAMEELKAKAEQAAKAADDDDTEADPTKPLTWPLAYAVESEASAAAAEAEAAKAVLSSEELRPNMEAAEAAEAVLSSDQLSAEGAPSTAPTSPKPPNTAPQSPRITSLASPRAGDSSPLQKLQSQSAAKMAINPTPEEARDTPITRAFKEKIAAERESFIKSRETAVKKPLFGADLVEATKAAKAIEDSVAAAAKAKAEAEAALKKAKAEAAAIADAEAREAAAAARAAAQKAIAEAQAANKAALEAAAAKEAADKETAEKLLYEPNYTVTINRPDASTRWGITLISKDARNEGQALGPPMALETALLPVYRSLDKVALQGSTPAEKAAKVAKDYTGNEAKLWQMLKEKYVDKKIVALIAAQYDAWDTGRGPRGPPAPIISDLAKGALAFESGLMKVDHLLVAVNGNRVKTPDEGTAALKGAAAGPVELTLWDPAKARAGEERAMLKAKAAEEEAAAAKKAEYKAGLEKAAADKAAAEKAAAEKAAAEKAVADKAVADKAAAEKAAEKAAAGAVPAGTMPSTVEAAPTTTPDGTTPSTVEAAPTTTPPPAEPLTGTQASSVSSVSSAPSAPSVSSASSEPKPAAEAALPPSAPPASSASSAPSAPSAADTPPPTAGKPPAAALAAEPAAAPASTAPAPAAGDAAPTTTPDVYEPTYKVTINKPELSARWGITLESKPQIGGAPKAPTITKLADGGLAIASGKVKVTHLLIAVNGTIVKGHEDGTALLKNAVGDTELTLYAPEIAAAKAAAAALAAGERPLPIGVGKTSSSWKKVPSASRPGAFSYLHEPSGYKQAEFPENDWLPDDAPAQFHKKMKNKK